MGLPTAWRPAAQGRYRTVGTSSHREGKSFKKTVYAMNRRGPTLPAGARDGASTSLIEAARLVSSTKHGSRRIWGLCAVGTARKRMVARVPHGHWRTLTFLAALRANALPHPACLTGDQRRELLRYVESNSCADLEPGDIVVMDNLGSHKGRSDPSGSQGCRCKAHLPSALQSRSQPHRAGLLNAEHWLRTARENHRRRFVSASLISRPSRQKNQQLLRQRRIPFRLESFRSRSNSELRLVDHQDPPQGVTVDLGHGRGGAWET